MKPLYLSTVLAITSLAVSCSAPNRTSSAAVASVIPQVNAATAPQAMMSSPSASVRNSGALTLVPDRSQVCMVNNQYMGRPQIPVEVGGRTYYGCCEMCKGRLANDASARTATDPVSNRSVDKSQAVIARAANGNVLYFETDANFAAYTRRAATN